VTAEKPGKLFVAAAVLSTLFFGFLILGLAGAITAGLKDSEVLVVALYTSACSIAAIGSLASLVHSPHWAPVAAIAAIAAGASCYALEAKLRGAEEAGFAFVLITTPMLLAALLGGTYLDWRRRSRRGTRATIQS
jgi:hypothetical protein